MKAWKIYASSISHMERGEVVKLHSLKDLVKLLDQEKCQLVIDRNRYYHNPFPNKELWDILAAKGYADCELEIIVYDDYLE